MKRTLLVGATLPLLFALTAWAEADKGKKDDPSIEGTWVIVGGERFGMKEPKERIKGDVVQITKDSIAVTDKDKKETYVASYKLDRSKKPWAITMTSTMTPTKGEVSHGIIERSGEELRVCYALPGGKTPTEFKTEAKQLMFIMKRSK